MYLSLVPQLKSLLWLQCLQVTRPLPLSCLPCVGTVLNPVGLGFLLGGTPYPNNSVVALEDIGQAAPGSLYCLTNSITCCRGQDREGPAIGEWFLPGETDPVVGVNSVGTSSPDFTRARAPSAVLLNHLTTTGPSGVYHCEIPDASGQLRTLYIGVDTTGTVM